MFYRGGIVHQFQVLGNARGNIFRKRISDDEKAYRKESIRTANISAVETENDRRSALRFLRKRFQNDIEITALQKMKISGH